MYTERGLEGKRIGAALRTPLVTTNFAFRYLADDVMNSTLL